MPNKYGKLTYKEKQALFRKAEKAGIKNYKLETAASTLEGGKRGIVAATVKGEGGYVGTSYDYATGKETSYSYRKPSRTTTDAVQKRGVDLSIRGEAVSTRGRGLEEGVYTSPRTGKPVYVGRSVPARQQVYTVETSRGSALVSGGVAEKLRSGGPVLMNSRGEPLSTREKIQYAAQPSTRTGGYGVSSYRQYKYPEVLRTGFGGSLARGVGLDTEATQLQPQYRPPSNRKSYYEVDPVAAKLESYRSSFVTRYLPSGKPFKDETGLQGMTLGGQAKRVANFGIGTYNFIRGYDVATASKDVSIGVATGAVFKAFQVGGSFLRVSSRGVQYSVVKPGLAAKFSRAAVKGTNVVFGTLVVGGYLAAPDKTAFGSELLVRGGVGLAGFRTGFGTITPTPVAPRLPRQATFLESGTRLVPSERLQAATAFRVERSLIGSGYSLGQEMKVAVRSTKVSGLEVFTGRPKQTVTFGPPKIVRSTDLPTNLGFRVSGRQTASMEYGRGIKATARGSVNRQYWDLRDTLLSDVKSGGLPQKVFGYGDRFDSFRAYSRTATVVAPKPITSQLAVYRPGFARQQDIFDLMRGTKVVLNVRGRKVPFGEFSGRPALTARETTSSSGVLLTETNVVGRLRSKQSGTTFVVPYRAVPITQGVGKSALVPLAVRRPTVKAVGTRTFSPAALKVSVIPKLAIRPANRFKTVLAPKLATSSITSTTTRQVTNLATLSNTRTSYAQIVTPTNVYTPPTEPRTDLFPGFGLAFGGGVLGGRRRYHTVGARRSYSYTPSLVSLSLGIRGRVRVPKGGFTGLEIRPIPI